MTAEHDEKDILDHFDELAGDYETFKKGIPHYREMMAVIQEVFDYWGSSGSLKRILELGTGTGELARAVVDSYEPDFFKGIDGSENMVSQTQARFEGFEGPTEVKLFTRVFSEWSPSVSYDLIYSSLAVHHLDNPSKNDLFETIHQALKPGGHFLLCDVFRRRTSLLNVYRTIKHNRLLDRGLSESEAGEHWESHVPNRTLADWESFYARLEEIGFEAVDCVWRDMYRATFIADKPEST